jgi:hypothetical protein
MLAEFKPPVITPPTLQQKFVKLREAVPAITQKQHSDGVKYKFAKIFDIYELLTPAMNKYGVNFDPVAEVATRHYENGDAMFYHSYQQSTRSGTRTVWVYEADLTFRWTNADDPADIQEVTLHAIGTNDGGPDKAKGSAWTYCLKYYLFEKFGIDQGEDDPDNTDRRADGQQYGQQQTQPRLVTLSEAQMKRLYAKAEAAGMSREKTDQRILKVYGQSNPNQLTKAQYDEICTALDAAATKPKEEQQNAE